MALRSIVTAPTIVLRAATRHDQSKPPAERNRRSAACCHQDRVNSLGNRLLAGLISGSSRPSARTWALSLLVRCARGCSASAGSSLGHTLATRGRGSTDSRAGPLNCPQWCARVLTHVIDKWPHGGLTPRSTPAGSGHGPVHSSGRCGRECTVMSRRGLRTAHDVAPRQCESCLMGGRHALP
jgi:hypothetical protein